MKLKQYVQWLAKHVPTDSESPTDIIQQLAALLGMRLSLANKLPNTCGIGDTLDMDIVQEGILKGLERLNAFDEAKGNLKQFLYLPMMGRMIDYAWERENRVGDCRPRAAPLIHGLSAKTDDTDGEDWEGEGDVMEFDKALVEPALVTSTTPETTMEADEEGTRRLDTVRGVASYLGPVDMAMLLRDAQIGYSAIKRLAWAEELGVSLGALQTKLARLRRDARDWAMSVQ